ncbi:hypothetical protein G9A89_021925 [Geosiphon pyriformis]|nr:hypothetical protein G9A89_021925 [Geosiphon pyriformis]
MQQPIYQPPIYQPTTSVTLGNLSAPTNSNTATELISKWNPKAKTDTTKLEIINGKSRQWNLGTEYTQNPNFQNYLSLLVTPEDTTFTKLETNQKPLTSNILSATICNDGFLAAIFSFELEEPVEILLFSGAILESKPITTMYTDAKVDDQHIKLILNSRSASIDCTASTCIITANGVTKTLIGKINNFLFEVNNIIIPIKVLVMEATQYQALNTQEQQFSQNSHHTCVPATCGHFKTTPDDKPLIELEEEEKKPT